MADIKQAAKWMQEGKEVYCPMGFRHSATPTGLILMSDDKKPAELYVSDLLADDWELAD